MSVPSASRVGPWHSAEPMGKLLALLLLAAMAVQVIRPLGLPGLTRRGDFWKIAVAAKAVMMLAALVRP